MQEELNPSLLFEEMEAKSRSRGSANNPREQETDSPLEPPILSVTWEHIRNAESGALPRSSEFNRASRENSG